MTRPSVPARLDPHAPARLTPAARWARRCTAITTLLASLSLLPALAAPARSFAAAAAPRLLITAVDTMKESRDTEARPLTDAQIAQDVALSASLHNTYVTVDTHWDYPDYMSRWVRAVRAAGKHVWFRIHPNQWGNNNGTTGIMAPRAYETAEYAFIVAHPTFFQLGDILDPCPEPENGLYWIATYGSGWTSNAPNAATREYNAFIRDTTTVANVALSQIGVNGVTTTVRSTNSFFAAHPNVLDQVTVAMLGRITVDSYPDATTTDPAAAAQAWVNELNAIAAVRQVPIVIGEMGYSRSLQVDDATQERVLRSEFAALATLPYLSGANYWVGAGTNNSGGYTHLFSGTHGAWTLRPAGANLAAFFTTYGATS